MKSNFLPFFSALSVSFLFFSPSAPPGPPLKEEKQQLLNDMVIIKKYFLKQKVNHRGPKIKAKYMKDEFVILPYFFPFKKI